MRLLWKILQKHISVSQFTGIIVSLLIGFCIILLSCQFFFDIKPLFIHKENNLWGENYIIISKKVSIINTFTNTKTHFTQQELDEIKQQNFVEDIATFIPSKFSVRLYSDVSDKFPEFYTDLFFEAVPDDFLDIKTQEWKWNKNDNFIPIIVPKYYLALYNFGFAISQGLPQISESTINKIPLKIVIYENGKQAVFRSKIISFSNRINTILVPSKFLLWANKNYGKEEKNYVSRIILKSNNTMGAEMLQFFAKKNFDMNQEKLKITKSAYFFKIISIVIISIGLLITGLSFALMILSFNLILQKNKDKILNLNLIGYNINKIALPYQLISIIINTSLFLLSLIITSFLQKIYIDKIQLLYENNLSTGVSNTILIGIVLLFFITSLNLLLTKNTIKRIIKKNL